MAVVVLSWLDKRAAEMQRLVGHSFQLSSTKAVFESVNINILASDKILIMSFKQFIAA
jgi:hypothetical protein